MDAQNAAESTATKHAASTTSLSRPGNNPEQQQANKSSSSTSPVTKPSTSTFVSKSTPVVKESKSNSAVSQQSGHDEDVGADNNSEAETIVLAGKDGSPVKSRKVIKHEDNSDEDRRLSIPSAKRKLSDGKNDNHGAREGSSGGGNLAPDTAKRKRLITDQPRRKDSSGLSSVPGSPMNHSRQRSAEGRRDSDSESVHARSAKAISKDKDSRDKDAIKSRPGDRPVSHKRKVNKAESDDDAEHENHKARRRRTSVAVDASSTLHRPQQKDRDHTKLAFSKTSNETLPRHRSNSPHFRTHRRSASTQVVSQSSSGLSQKKKRIPPPLTTDYHSDESSASGSPAIRSSTLRGLATPATAESNMSAKNPAHKKHVDAHGQTQLAKACSRGEYENVKKRLQERPQDLNFPDYAGNTPLQIAAINGYDDIVKLLVDAGCDIDCVNHDKETPLIDAVDNDHLEVVKVLLDAGVNPRKANVNGEEPLDRVDMESDNAKAIKQALIEAKKRMGERRKTSEEHQDQQDALSSHGPDSPRRSPAIAEQTTSSRRAASSRSHKLSNHLLYIPMDDKTLRAAAGRGDVETVERVLQIRDNFDHAESMVAAARGGHETVMNLLLALGNANPDPSPVKSAPGEIATPILAAIGQENVRVIRLLLAQTNFDPTRRFRGDTYYELARKRQGPNWKEEEQILKEAYDAYRKAHRDPMKKSPNRRDQDAKRAGRTESRDDSAKLSKRKGLSPEREGHRVSSKSKTLEKESKGIMSNAPKNDEPTSPKRGPGRPKKEDRGLPTISISDGEGSPPTSKTSSKSKRPDPDIAAMSSEGEAKPRKRLMSGRDLKEQREKNRRASMVSNSSSLREPSSPRDTRHDDPHEPPTEKYHDRAKALKRDDSRDRLSVSGEHAGKRSRTSATPDHGASEKEGEPVKRRRLDMEKKDRLPKASASPDRNRKPAPSRDTPTSSRQDEKQSRKHVDSSDKKDVSKNRKIDSSDPIRREPGKSTASDKSIHVKPEDADIVMHDSDQAQDEESKARVKDEDKKRRAELEAKKRELEERKRREDEERRQIEAKKRLEDEKEKKRLEEEERKKREDEARKRHEEAERILKQREDEERQRKAEEERLRLEREENERKKREEDERIRKEREAAEEARRKREEEEQRRILDEQKRAAQEFERRKQREEQERQRLHKLPASLRWLDRSTNAKTPDMAKRWRFLRGVRFDSIRPETAGTSRGREQWILNTQVAMLLGESDLELRRYSGWERTAAPEAAKLLVMGLSKPHFALLEKSAWELGRQLPGYYFDKEPDQLTYEEKRQLFEQSKSRFLAMDLFFVKLADFMHIVPNVPHLRDLEMVVSYHEAAETVEKHINLEHPSRWQDDPDAAQYHGYCPRHKYFVNGQLVREGKVDLTSASSTPWPESRVPRNGLVAVPPTDPNYTRLAKEQGLDHLLSTGLRTPPMTTGAQTSPNQVFPPRPFDGLSPPQSESTATVNGDGLQALSSTTSTADQPLVNGNMESTQVGGHTHENN